MYVDRLTILELLSLYARLSSWNIQETPCNWINSPSLLKTFIGQRSLSGPLPLTVQALGNRVCLMCWQFHLTLLSLSLILLASSLRSVANDCLQPPHFLLLLLQPPPLLHLSLSPPPHLPGAGCLSPTSEGDAEKVNESKAGRRTERAR